MQKKGKHTICIHEGEIKDTQFGGAVSPIFMATSYPFLEQEKLRYPRYFNTPNQEALAIKIAALENTEAGLLFGSGMAAVSTALLAYLNKGDHLVIQNDIYGGTFHFVEEELNKFGIEYTFTRSNDPSSFKNAIKSNTKVIYLETPSNPLLSIVDIKAITKIAKDNGLISMIDNTFASPINQTPIDLGVDIVIHSATKYLGGHSDILAGAVVSDEENIEKIFQTGKNFGGNISHFISYLLERSIKTLGVRVTKHNENAMYLATYLNNHQLIDKVYYPGLKDHKDHDIAKEQMHGFGGMLSFELNENLNAIAFQKQLKLIKPSMSLAGVESTILQPSETSHKLIGPEERAKQGIKDGLLRFSVGLENKEDLIEDIEQALKNVMK